MCGGYLPGIYSLFLAAPWFPFGELPLSHWLWCWWMVNPGTSLYRSWSDLIFPLKAPGQQGLCSFNHMVSESGVRDITKEHRGLMHFISGTLTCQETLLGFFLLVLAELPWCLPISNSDSSTFWQFSVSPIILLPEGVSLQCVFIFLAFCSFPVPFGPAHRLPYGNAPLKFSYWLILGTYPSLLIRALVVHLYSIPLSSNIFANPSLFSIWSSCAVLISQCVPDSLYSMSYSNNGMKVWRPQLSGESGTPATKVKAEKVRNNKDVRNLRITAQTEGQEVLEKGQGNAQNPHKELRTRCHHNKKIILR